MKYLNLKAKETGVQPNALSSKLFFKDEGNINSFTR